MTELIESLRHPSRFTDQLQNMEDAADEIEKLTAERDAYAKAADDMAASHKVERDALTLELGVQTRAANHWMAEANRDHNALQRITAEPDALRADAERYRYLRSKQMQYSLPNNTVALLVSDVTALDATMKETK